MALAAQKRSTTSGPKNVSKEQTAPEENGGQVKTIIFNFARYYKGGVSRNRFPIVPLEDQFRNLGEASASGLDEPGFFQRFLYSGSKKISHIFLSHPAFDKEGCRGKGAALYNVAARIVPPQHSSKRQDLVLLGNFEHRQKDDRWEFCVTGFYVERSTGRYFGEIEVQAKVVSVFRHPDDTFEEFDTDGKASGRRVGVQEKNNLINAALADRLCGCYSVPNHRDAESNLRDWAAFLDHIEELKGTAGFTVERPEFFHVYGVPADGNVDPASVVFTDNGIAWIREAVKGTPQRAIVKVTHNVDPSLPGNRIRKYIDAFNELSMQIPVIVDPLIEEERSHLLMKKEEREEWSRLSQIGTIFNEVRQIQTLPQEDVERLEAERDSAIVQIREGREERIESSLAGALEEYMSSEEGTARREAFVASYSDRIGKMAEEAQEDIAEERYAASAREGTGMTMREARESVTEEESVAAAENMVIGILRDAVRQELLGAVTERCDQDIANEIAHAEKKCRRKLEKLAKKKGTNTLEAFYRLPSDGTRSIEEDIGERTAHFASLGTYVLKDNDISNRAAVKRLNEALNVVRDGAMRNPYMMSFLYLPEFVPAPFPERINHFFGSGFNEYQKKAISRAVGANGIYMIQGPPGTGKTQVIAEITAQEVVRGRKVLITSQGNKAVDNAFERISRYGFIRPLRIMSMSRESDYDVSNLLPKLYDSIRDALEEREHLLGEEGFSDGIRKDIQSFEDGYAEYHSLDVRTSTMRADAERKAKDAVADSQRTNSAQKRKCEGAYQEYYGLLDRKDRLMRFDKNELGPAADEIRAVFGWISDGGDILFGNEGACRALMNLTDEDAEDLSAALRDPARQHTVSGGIVARSFAGGDASSIPAVRSRLSDILNVAVSQLDRDIASQKENIDSIIRTRADEVPYSEPAIDSDDYREYIRARDRLLTIASSIFDRLHIPESFDDVDSAKRVIDDASAMMHFLEKEEKAQDIFRDIRSFLSEEGVGERNKDRLLRAITDRINVFGITCTANLYVDTKEGLGNRSDIIDLRRCGIDTVIIDEVSKVPFSELIRPIAFCRKVIMVGDHRQLPPVYIEGEEDEDLGRKFSELYQDSLFRNIFERVPEASRIMLRTQYRMAQQIMDVVNMFYDEPLEMPAGVPADWRAHRISVPGLLDEGCSVLFVDCKGSESHRSGSTSVYNAAEARLVAKIVKLLDRNCHTDADGHPLDAGGRLMTMGVITPYRDQNLAIARELRMDPDDRSEFRLSLRQFQSDGEEGFKVKSVDDFQGDERDVMILSLVRTRSSNFIQDYRRINVAMSRARRLLVIVGNADVLSEQEVDLGGARGKEKVYAKIIDMVKDYGGFVDGSSLAEVEE